MVFKTLKGCAASDNDIPVVPTIGKLHLGLMCPQHPYAGAHDAIPILHNYAENGCPVDCGDNWSLEHIMLMLRRGPHRSALSKTAIRQLRHETLEKVRHKYARIVKWKDIKDKLPPNLKISPVAMIPHKSKPFRCILDLSFALEHEGVKYPSVNENTKKLAHQQAMGQLGLVIKRLIQTMVDNQDNNLPFWFAKLDVKDGFWRMAVSDDNAWNFTYVLPSLQTTDNVDDVELVVPNSLQMGWSESPPLFCSGSETARDIMESLRDQPLPPHPYETDMLKEVLREATPDNLQSSTTLIEAYVDDFITATNDGSLENLKQLSRAMLHGIHSIFPPPTVTGHNGHDSIAHKKLVEGDGLWSTRKEVLGWEVDGRNYTIQLPRKKCAAILTLTRKCCKLQCAPLKLFQKLAGKLQHASLAIPSGRSLFTPIDMAMKNDPATVVIDDNLRQCLHDWRFLVQCLAQKPTHMRQLVTRPPTFISYTDACKLGAGGVWCSGTTDLHPFLWQVEWPQEIQAALITLENPSGSVTINDLELAGALLGFLVLESRGIPLQFYHLATFCDNMTTVVWAYKLRNSKSKIAGFLLRFLGLRLHQAGCSSMVPHHIAGNDNLMADAISRAFKKGKFFEVAHNLVAFFNKSFPLAQNASWNECVVPTELVSCVIACLHGRLLPMASLLRQTQPGKSTGDTGQPLRAQQGSTHYSQTSLPLNVTSSQEHLLLGSGQGVSETEIRSRLLELQTPLPPSQRPSSWLDNPAPSTGRTRNTTSTLSA